MRGVLILTSLLVGTLLSAAVFFRQSPETVCPADVTIPTNPLAGLTIDKLQIKNIAGMATDETLRTTQRIWVEIPTGYHHPDIPKYDRVVVVLYTPNEGWDYLQVSNDGVIMPFDLNAAKTVCTGNCEIIWKNSEMAFAYTERSETLSDVLDDVTHFNRSFLMISDSRRLEVYVDTTNSQIQAECLMNDTLQQIFNKTVPPSL